MIKQHPVVLKMLTAAALSLLCSVANGQRSIAVSQNSKIFTDVFDNCYVVAGDKVEKMDSTFTIVARFRPVFGHITSVDPTDPFKVLLFQKDFYRITLLDNNLSPIGESQYLPDMGASFPLFACAMQDGGYWVFDGLQEKLLFYRNVGSTAYSSNDLSPILSQDAPTELKSYGNSLYLGIAGKGIAIFDKFGSFRKLIPEPEAAAHFQPMGENIFFINRHGDLCSLNTLVTEDPSVIIPQLGTIESFSIGKNFLFFVKGSQLTAAKLPLNFLQRK
ncbi:MAG TPA: hypothetical protein VMW01_14055 [Williamwhitmania sp.]|nr:hypothetical protein [Williamwhitmania sp.]